MLGACFSGSIGAIGVDIGTRALRLLQLRSSGGELKVVGAARVEAPGLPGAPSDWTPRPAQVAAALSAGGFTGRRCVVSLPRAEVRVQAVRLPRMSERELTQAVRWEAAARFEMQRDAMEVDHIPTGATVHGAEERDEVLMIAVSHAALDRWMEPLLQAGLRPMAVETDFTGLARAVTAQVRRDDDRSAVRAVVEVGGSGSSVMILRGEQIAFYKPLGLRGADLNRAVTEHLQIDEQAAADLRVARIAAACGPAPQGAPALDASTERAVYEAVRPLINEMVKEVVLCLRYYGVTFRGHPPSSILLGGGEGPEPHLGRLLEQSCNVPVVLDDPRRTFQGLIGQIGAKLGRHPGPPSCWAVAVGLSLRGLSQRRARRGGPAAPAAAPMREAA